MDAPLLRGSRKSAAVTERYLEDLEEETRSSGDFWYVYRQQQGTDHRAQRYTLVVCLPRRPLAISGYQTLTQHLVYSEKM